jgi:hypothetical protein
MRLGEVFLLVTDIVGDPEEALHDIWRRLVSGQIGSLRWRLLSDGGVQDTILDRTIWRSIRLFLGKDDQGREVVGMHVKKPADPSIAGPKCIFFLCQSDVRAIWPTSTAESTAPITPTPDTTVEIKARRKRPSTKKARVWEVLEWLDKKKGKLRHDWQPAEAERAVLPEYVLRWPDPAPKRDKAGKPKPPVSRREIFRVYSEYLKARPKK